MKSLFLCLALIIPFTRASAEPSQLVTNLDAGKSQTIVAYGTSLTAGGAWVQHLADAFQKRNPGLATVINSGGSGQWSEWGVANLDRQVISKEPDAVFIEFCINDSVERFRGSVAIAQKNLETMIDRILRAKPKCEIILMTMTPGNGLPEGHRSYRKDIGEYYQMYRDVAGRRGLLLIDHYPTWTALQRDGSDRFKKLVPDTIHPTAVGNAEIVTPAILTALGVAAPGPEGGREVSPGG